MQRFTHFKFKTSVNLIHQQGPTVLLHCLLSFCSKKIHDVNVTKLYNHINVMHEKYRHRGSSLDRLLVTAFNHLRQVFKLLLKVLLIEVG